MSSASRADSTDARVKWNRRLWTCGLGPTSPWTDCGRLQKPSRPQSAHGHVSRARAHKPTALTTTFFRFSRVRAGEETNERKIVPLVDSA